MSKKYLFERIANEIEHKIKLGEYKAGMLIPSEKKLQALYGVSRTTIRKALQQLVNQDLIIKKNGVGIYIKPKITSQNILQMTGVMKNKALGDSKKIVKEFENLFLEKTDKNYLIRRIGISLNNCMLLKNLFPPPFI